MKSVTELGELTTLMDKVSNTTFTFTSHMDTVSNRTRKLTTHTKSVTEVETLHAWTKSVKLLYDLFDMWTKSVTEVGTLTTHMDKVSKTIL